MSNRIEAATEFPTQHRRGTRVQRGQVSANQTNHGIPTLPSRRSIFALLGWARAGGEGRERGR
jgi:hypothetical protein